MSMTPAMLTSFTPGSLLGGGGLGLYTLRRPSGPVPAAGWPGPLAGVVAADELVGQIEVRLGVHHPTLLAVEDHGEALGGRDLLDDPVHALDDLAGGLLLLGLQILLMPHVRLLNLLHALLELGLLLTDLVGRHERALLVEVVDGLLEIFLLLVDLLLLLIEDLL